MATIKPFAAMRPDPKLAEKICELPYDVMSTEEARHIAHGNTFSFLHVSKPEIDLPTDIDAYSAEVYEQGRRAFRKLVSSGALRQDAHPCFYLYRQSIRNHSQTGVVAVASCAEYLDGIIRKHEFTRPDKEDDRVRHIEALNAQTGPAFLIYPAKEEIDVLVARITCQTPEISFTAPDGVTHAAWVIGDKTDQDALHQSFAKVPGLYIADGHHRSAAAARVFQSRRGSGQSAYYLNVIFPHNQVKILAYNRVLKDFNGRNIEQFIEQLRKVCSVHSNGIPVPSKKHEIGLYACGGWYTLEFKPELTRSGNAIERLDVTLLQKHVLEPLLGVDNPRTSKRINFVGGIRGTSELQTLVDSGEYACAFSMYPTSVEDLMAIADAGGIMPPKSTWFEPKLRDGLFSHMI